MSVFEEDRITLQKAAELLDVCPKTVRSYAKKGFQGVQLEHIPLPKKWQTSREAVQRFLKAVTVKQGTHTEPIESHEERRAKLHAETAHLRGGKSNRRSRKKDPNKQTT